MKQDFFQVVEVENNQEKTFSTARDVSLFLHGFYLSYFKVFKNGKELSLENVSAKSLKNYLQSI